MKYATTLTAAVLAAMTYASPTPDYWEHHCDFIDMVDYVDKEYASQTLTIYEGLDC